MQSVLTPKRIRRGYLITVLKLRDVSLGQVILGLTMAGHTAHKQLSSAGVSILSLF